MLRYILKRLLLLIPTLLGILAITFAVIQFVPGGPVEQLVALVDLLGGEMGHALFIDVAPQIGAGGRVAQRQQAGQRGRQPGGRPARAKAQRRLSHRQVCGVRLV